MFKVSFKNEYENIFFTDVETGEWIEEDLGPTELAREVGKQISSLQQHVHVPKNLIWHKEDYDSKTICFGFNTAMKGNNRMYEIYGANKKYMYTLVDLSNDEWQILGNSASLMSNIDPAFVEHVINILHLYTEDYK